MARNPTFGHTKSGKAVHATTADHHRDDTAYARLNKRVAVAVTNSVGTMTCAWIFCVIALLGLPTAVSQSLHGGGPLPIVQWVAQTFLQLVLLSIIIVGQNIQSEAADARAAKTFEDTEAIVDALRLDTDGGLKTIADKIDELKRA